MTISTTYRFFSFARTAAVAIVAGWLASPALAGQGARFETFVAEDGQHYFTLSVEGEAQPQSEPRDVVVVVDTSASQAGFYRDTALAAVEACVAQLQPGDRVRVVAADIAARSLNDEFVAPGSPSVADAVESIRQEAPLGSTDMQLALATASKLFDEGENRERTIIYVGDGMSPVNLLQGKEFGQLVETLREQRISVSSYAVGPQCDAELLAALANQTGGNLYVDAAMTWPDDAEGISTQRALEENRRRGAEVGKVLGEWVRATVIRPTATTWPAEVAAVYPEQMPPLRSDRDTVVVGKLTGANVDAMQVAITSEGQGAMRFEATGREASHDLSFLPQLVETAHRDGGLSLTTVGTAGLVETGRMLLAGVDRLTEAAERAVAIGDNQGAASIVETVLRRDPGNVRAETVQRLIERRAQQGPRVPAEEIGFQEAVEPAPAATAEGDLSLIRTAQAGQAAPAAPPAPPRRSGVNTIDGVPAADIVGDGSFLTETERRNRVFAEMLEREVDFAIREARDQMSRNPEGVAQNLKLMLESVRQAPELIAEVRAQLVDRLQSVLRETARASRIKSEVDRETEERIAAAREQQLLNERLSRRAEHQKQLMARFNALMDEGRYEEAQEIATIVDEVDPYGTAPVSAELWSRFARHHHLQMVTRELRHKSAFNTWYQIETSAIPFPDDPPIVYPAAAEWIDLTKRREKYKAVDLKGQGGAEEAINTALASPLSALGLNFTETPLSEVVNFLRDEYNIEVQLDTQALDDLGLTEDDTITINLRNITLRSALKLMLKQHDLTYIIADEVLLITSEDEALSRLTVKVYPVADLVLPIETPAAGGLGGGGGGFGGAAGGGGGGFGGGGGGFGGGGGGFGGGGGGGAFSVPEETAVTTVAPEAGKTAPKVEPKVEEAPEQAPKATRKDANASRAIVIDESVAPELFWDGYFGSQVRDQAVVREEVRQLMSEGKYDHVSALIQSALRHGQPQSWMYEALGIAMQMNGSDKHQIERALLSAADFARSVEELDFLAMYLTRSGLDKRALQLYQQVVKIDPMRHEAYAMGLRAAERADDLDGQKWATLGILQQAWPAEQSVVQDTAYRKAQAIIQQLVKANRRDEATAFRDAVVKASERDCVIRVSWTGDADIDLSVEEPGGTICSQADPRTPGGGVNLGDEFAGSTKNPNGIFSETYVCPRGFAGTYRAKIQSAWGKVTADKVTVDIYVNYLSENAQHQRHQLDLGRDGAGIEFDLENGRRVEPIEQQQLARALHRQEAISKAVLAQQLASLSDPRIAPLRGDAERALRQRLLGGQGAVGFQPVIEILPEGTNFFATGVVSADRRYVRITTVPFFSTIGDVSTFTFAGAAQQDDEDDGDDGDDGDNGNGNGNNNNN